MAEFYYRMHGAGTKNIVFLHGFGEDHSAFDEMISQLIQHIPDVTCYCIDIFFHGKSSYGNQPLTKQDWKKQFRNFLDEAGISTFYVVGFSLGGRFGISCALEFPEKTKGVFLIAPDGIYQSPWYRFANTSAGNWLFKYLIDHPPLFDQLIHFLATVGMISKPLKKFVDKTLHNDAQKKRVYQTWTYFHPLQYRLKEIRLSLNQSHLKIFLMLGTQDTVIQPRKILRRIAGISSMQSILIPSKHHRMKAQSTPHLISWLKRELL